MALKKASKTRFGKREKPHSKKEKHGCSGNRCRMGDLPAFNKKKWDKFCEKRKEKRKAKVHKK